MGVRSRRLPSKKIVSASERVLFFMCSALGKIAISRLFYVLLSKTKPFCEQNESAKRVIILVLVKIRKDTLETG